MTSHHKASLTKWKDRIEYALPWLLVVESLYLLGSIYTPLFKAEIAVAYGFIPFVHILDEILYLPSTLAILTSFSLAKPLPTLIAICTSYQVLASWGLLAAYLLKEYRKLRWSLLIFGVISALYDILTGLYIYGYTSLTASVIAGLALIWISNVHKRANQRWSAHKNPQLPKGLFEFRGKNV